MAQRPARQTQGRRKSKKKSKGLQTEKGAEALFVAGAEGLVRRGIRHPNPNKRLDPRVVDLKILAISICVVIGK